MRMRWIAGAGDLAGRDLQRRVQAASAVALVIVRHPRRAKPGLIGSVGWVRSKAWISRLLIHAQDDRALRRVEGSSPTTSITFSTSCGSLENLNERT